MILEDWSPFNRPDIWNKKLITKKRKSKVLWSSRERKKRTKHVNDSLEHRFGGVSQREKWFRP